jgi:O-antigen/teichoic acid export membrane protein
MTSLKQKTIHGLSWSFLDSFSNQGIFSLVGIVLARLIEPAEFAVLAMIAIFTAVAASVVDSGFRSALIRKNDCTGVDYSTVFYFNLGASILLYGILFFAAPFFARFFAEPRLTSITRICSLSLIINSFSIVQGVLLTKKIDFKTQAKISMSSSIISGIIAIILAYKGMGVWSLVWWGVIYAVVSCLFLWLQSHWRPIWVFSTKSFKELFGFGSKLLISGLIDTIYNNIYYPIIGKCFPPATLAFYHQAITYSSLLSTTLTSNIQRVSYPVLSSIQDDAVQLKAGFRKIIKTTMLIAFTLMLGLAVIAEPLILTLIGENWLPCVPYLQLMCFSSMLYPLHAINLNIINVRGRSDLFLKLEIIKKSIAVPLIFVAIYWGIEALLIGGIIISVISYFLNSYYSAGLINYSTKEQLKDILPLLFVAACVSLVVYGITSFHLNSYFTLILQIIVCAALTIGIYERLKTPEYLDMKQIVIDHIKKIKQ